MDTTAAFGSQAVVRRAQLGQPLVTVLETDSAPLQDTDRFILETTSDCYVDDVNIGQFDTEYAYDALGRRIEKRHADGTATRYVYDGSRVAEEWDVSGGGSASLSASYVYGNYIDEVLTMRRGTSDYYYHGDDQHNVVKLTDNTGTVVESYDYGDYGQLEFYDPSGALLDVSESPFGNPYLFTGRRWDEELGYYYFRNRYLDPALGRFVSRDPIGLWGDAANLGNGYTYAASNPWSMVDPFGLCGGNVKRGFFGRLWDGFRRWLDDSHSGNIERAKSRGSQVGIPVDYDRLGENADASQILSATLSEGGKQNRDLGEEVAKKLATEAALGAGGAAVAGSLDDAWDQYKAAKNARRSMPNGGVPGRVAELPSWSASEDLIVMQKPSRKRWHTYENPGHHDPDLSPTLRTTPYNPQKQIIPKNVEALWHQSVYLSDTTRWAIEGTGRHAVFHRFSGQNGRLHWSGSTSTAGAPLGQGGIPRVIVIDDIPQEIRNLAR